MTCVMPPDYWYAANSGKEFPRRRGMTPWHARSLFAVTTSLPRYAVNRVDAGRRPPDQAAQAVVSEALQLPGTLLRRGTERVRGAASDAIPGPAPSARRIDSCFSVLIAFGRAQLSCMMCADHSEPAF